MSLPLTVEVKSQAKNEIAMKQHKCRIPQRLPTGRQRPAHKPRTVTDKNKPEPVMNLHPKHINKAYRLRDTESGPKTVNKDDDVESFQSIRVLSRVSRKERLSPAKTFPSVNKKITNNKPNEMSNRTGRQFVTVPVKQKTALPKSFSYQRSPLCDQDTIMKSEGLELQRQDSLEVGHLVKLNESNHLFLDSHDEDYLNSCLSRKDKMAFLKNNWDEKNKQFQDMKDELYKRQKMIMEVYAFLRNIKESLCALGLTVEMPTPEDLRIMNVHHMTPAQLLQLCSGNPLNPNETDKNSSHLHTSLQIDINKLSEMPSKLVAICEQILVNKKEFINWFRGFLNNSEKEYSKQKLIKKVNEFNEENKMVDSTLEYSRNQFIKDTADHLGIYLNEIICLRLQNEELLLKLSESDAQNKNLISNEQQKANTNKLRIEELEKDLEKENQMKITLKDTLSRAEGQIQKNEEISAHLQNILKQSQKTIQQLHEKNEQQQKHFDKESKLLKDSMLNNTLQLEQIAKTREALLQSERDDLKKKYEELSKNYNESVHNLKQDINKYIEKLIDVEKKHHDEVDAKIVLAKKIESQSAENEELKIRCKETQEQLQEMEATLNQTLVYKEHLEAITLDLNKNVSELARYKNRVSEQNKIIREFEYNYNKSQENEENLKNELDMKAENITELEHSKNILEKQLQESESKLQMYENELCTLREEIKKLKENFGEFQNLNDLHELVNKENENLVQTKEKFNKITEDINRKRMTLNQLDETLAEQEELLKQRTQILEVLSEKEEEKTDIKNLNREIEEKNSEINALVANIELREKQISQLEKIILTLEDQNRKAAFQERKDYEIIDALEKKVCECELYIENRLNRRVTSENLDNLIKILEDEMDTPYPSRLLDEEEGYSNYRDTQTLDNRHNAVRCKHFNNGHRSMYQQNNEYTPTKIVLRNYVKNTYNIPNDKYKSDLDRKQANTNIDTQKWFAHQNTEAFKSFNDKNLYFSKVEDQAIHPTERYLKNLKNFEPNQSRMDKESKMSKLAAHRLT